MYYGDSVEERRYLSGVRKEKDAFTKLIREKSVSVPKLQHTFLTNVFPGYDNYTYPQ